MKSTNTLLTVARLIAIKREELEHHRLDLLRLQQILQAETAKLNKEEEMERSFVEGMRAAETGAGRLNAAAMIESRRYFVVLQTRSIEQQRVCDEIDAQRSLAQSELERIFSEMRALERLAERRETTQMLEVKRVGYLHADDQEITRVANKRSEHVSY